MVDTTLKDRLLEHAKSFDGLLSLIPAKHYYGEDNSDQWKKKKQTKEQAAAAQRAKLDPASVKSAKDVMDERARKRKLNEMAEVEEMSDIEGVQRELPKKELKDNNSKTIGKKQKILDLNNGSQQSSDHQNSTEKHRLKREKSKKQTGNSNTQAHDKNEKATTASMMDQTGPKEKSKQTKRIINENMLVNDHNIDSDVLKFPKTSTNDAISSPAISDSSTPTTDVITGPSSNTSTTSIISPAKVLKPISLPTDPDILRSRLASRIEALRAARKADGPDGRPARNRQELQEARRKKEEQRRAHKKELRLKARLEDEVKRKGNIISGRNQTESKPENPTVNRSDQNLSFGRISFADGQQLTNDLSAFRKTSRKRGPQDIETSLLISEKKRHKIENLDEEKRKDIQEKELWLNVKKRVYGEKLRDNHSLLNKTLKRKEKAKKKSEKEWIERKDGVAKSQAIRQKKREENLNQRRESKGKKGKGKGKGKKTSVKSRPGFEGSFTSGKRK